MTNQEIKIAAVAALLHIDNVTAFQSGYEDGKEQGFELTWGVTYDSDYDQWAYDVGTHIGACIAAHPDTKEN